MNPMAEIIKNWDRDHPDEPMFDEELVKTLFSINSWEIESVRKICDI